MTHDGVPSAPAPESAPDSAGTAATPDPRVNALLQRAARIQSLPVGEHQRHYGQLLDELTAELDADPGSATAMGQAQP